MIRLDLERIVSSTRGAFVSVVLLLKLWEDEEEAGTVYWHPGVRQVKCVGVLLEEEWVRGPRMEVRG